MHILKAFLPAVALFATNVSNLINVHTDMLASDEATYITGTELNIDGGLLAGSAASPDG